MTQILIKRSATSGSVPMSLAQGELAINTADNILFWADTSGTIRATPPLNTLVTQSQITALIAGAPTALDTLKELADAIGDDANFASTVTTALGNRLRLDTAAQSLTDAQAGNALTNLKYAQRVDVVSSWTALQKHNARYSVGSAPWDALAYKNLAYNPRHVISQINGSNAVASVNGYVTDGYTINTSGIVASGQRVASPFGSRPDIPFGLRATITTAKAALAAGDYIFFEHKVEGLRARRLLFGSANAKNAFIGFFCNFPAGTYYVTIRNAALNRAITQKFVSTATETFVTLIFPGDTAGTWATDTSTGLDITITAAAGSTYQTSTVGSYVAANVFAGTDQTNGAATAGATFTMSDLIVLDMTPGVVTDPTQVVPAERLPFFQVNDVDALRDCQRYYWTGFLVGFGARLASDPNGIIRATLNYSGLNLRALPSVALVVNSGFADGDGTQQVWPSSYSIPRVYNTGLEALGYQPSGVGTTAGAGFSVGATANLDSRL